MRAATQNRFSNTPLLAAIQKNALSQKGTHRGPHFETKGALARTISTQPVIIILVDMENCPAILCFATISHSERASVLQHLSRHRQLALPSLCSLDDARTFSGAPSPPCLTLSPTTTTSTGNLMAFPKIMCVSTRLLVRGTCLHTTPCVRRPFSFTSASRHSSPTSTPCEHRDATRHLCDQTSWMHGPGFPTHLAMHIHTHTYT